MGTRGYIVIKFNNKYYAIYIPYDSYFSHLGTIIIEYLKKLIQENELNNTENCLNIMIEYFTHKYKKLEESYTIENNSVELEYFDAEWIYTIDLEKLLLTIKGCDFHPYFVKYSLIKDNEFSIFNCMEV